jgi:hypothetical protein
MKHAGSAALDALEPLLTRLRAITPLKEKARGVFYLKSRAFLHFHEDPSGLWADIRAPSATDFDRIRADDEDGPARIIDRVRAAIGPG